MVREVPGEHFRWYVECRENIFDGTLGCRENIFDGTWGAQRRFSMVRGVPGEHFRWYMGVLEQQNPHFRWYVGFGNLQNQNFNGTFPKCTIENEGLLEFVPPRTNLYH